MVCVGLIVNFDIVDFISTHPYNCPSVFYITSGGGQLDTTLRYLADTPIVHVFYVFAYFEIGADLTNVVCKLLLDGEQPRTYDCQY